MGLDMYLKANVYIGGKYEHRKVTGSIEIAIDSVPLGLKLEQIDSISIEMGYWRKANAIHHWFVSEVQDGVDECNSTHCRLEQLTTLKSICESVLSKETSPEEELPTSSGFFFGSTDYGEYYYEDLRETVNIINSCIELERSLPGEAYVDFAYQSSW